MEKTVKSVIDFILQNKEIFPEWGISLVVYLVLAWGVILILKNIAKSIQDPELIKAALFISSKTRDASKRFLQGASVAIESPIKRPRTRFVGTVLSVMHSYLMAVIFLCFTIGTAALHFAVQQELAWYLNVFLMGLIPVFFWFTLFFRAEADRDFISAKEQWGRREEW
ncbi:hypothetical protein [Alkalimonas mucilaginosa]|uniref:Uncharacterized protein n=1 Tax=Alkalimonas mucilaginosa TaxID=3057676 RepID=A0ABU7JBH4_9GAMM|nr:hypothetical protein [Alkalimonas sp. MEB004]MEE2023042.1 hypothetical protein [Alkalimonas sp. MEB004]